MKSIALLGFMGAGKSYYGKKISNSLLIPFVDFDSHLETMYGTSIPVIMDNFGEDGFRLLERNALGFITILDRKIILATGGGTPCFHDCLELLNDNFETIYLKQTPEKLIERLSNDTETAKRPLLKDKNIATFVREKLVEREPFYAKAKYIAHSEEELFSIIDQLTGRAN